MEKHMINEQKNTEDLEVTADEEISDDQLIEDIDEDSGDSKELEVVDVKDVTTSDATFDNPEYDDDLTMESVVEAILFASDDPLTASKLVNVVEAGSNKQIHECINSLNDKYEQCNCAFRIEKIAGGYQMMTLPQYNHWLRKLLRVKTDTKLSQAALETLAIVSYKQPIIRADVEAIRGVASGEVLRNLMYKGLVKIVGRAEVLGRPMLYGTTKKFLDAFGLNTLKDLPKVDELKKPQ